MKRKIKFRGKRKDNGEWIYGDLLTMDGGCCEISDWDTVDYGRYDVDPDTVGQFTDCCAKDTTPIYEGDIVECVSWNEYFTNTATGEVMQPFRRKMYVDFRKGGFKMVEPMPEPMKDNVWDIIYNGDVQVIGNIHDNPDLLESNMVISALNPIEMRKSAMESNNI